MYSIYPFYKKINKKLQKVAKSIDTLQKVGYNKVNNKGGRIMEQVKRELKALRARIGLTQKDVAERLGIHTQTYIEYENNAGKFKIETLYKLAPVLEIDVKELVDIFFSLVNYKK